MYVCIYVYMSRGICIQLDIYIYVFYARIHIFWCHKIWAIYVHPFTYRVGLDLLAVHV